MIEKQYHEPVCEGSSGVRLSCPRQRVACKQQFAPRDEIKEVFPFELARDAVAASDGFENGDVPQDPPSDLTGDIDLLPRQFSPGKSVSQLVKRYVGHQ